MSRNISLLFSSDLDNLSVRHFFTDWQNWLGQKLFLVAKYYLFLQCAVTAKLGSPLGTKQTRNLPILKNFLAYPSLL